MYYNIYKLMKAFERDQLESRDDDVSAQPRPLRITRSRFLTRKLHSNFGFQKFLLLTVFIQRSSTF